MTAVTSHVRPRAFGLDVIRVLAALAVVVTHVAFVTGVVNPQRWSSPLRDVLPRLDVGVNVFFVLSGLLVTRPFVRRYLAGSAQGPLSAYARRRLSRIYPLYWVVLGVVVLTAATRPSWTQLLADALLVHTYRPAWAIGPITQSWSLATEVAFYAFVPVWFAVLRRLAVRFGCHTAGSRSKLLAAGLVGWVLVALAWRVGVVVCTDRFVVGVPGAVDTRGALLTWLPNHLDAFAVGAALGLWLESGRARVLTPWARISCYAAAAGALWTASNALGLPPVFTGFDGPQTLWRHALFVVCAGALVAPSAAALSRVGVTRRAWTPALVTRLATGAALASYGVYLWH
ncbi:MAG: acyltransferase, partial [Actinobacteria bacterium]|nr:acyltransferase [Actinomycetota bacterium]